MEVNFLSNHVPQTKSAKKKKNENGKLGRKEEALFSTLIISYSFLFFIKVHSFIQGFICSVVTKWPGPFCIEFACSVGALVSSHIPNRCS